jgi:hypothetical protein
MPEAYYIDLTPGVTDVPPETWKGIDVSRVTDHLLEDAGIPPDSDEARTIGLRSLIRRQRPKPLSDDNRAFLAENAPRMLGMIEAEQRSWQWEIDNGFW